MRKSILNKIANNDIILKVLERFYQNFHFWKNLEYEKFTNFFPNFKAKVCSQDFSENEQEVDFPSDLLIFK